MLLVTIFFAMKKTVKSGKIACHQEQYPGFYREKSQTSGVAHLPYLFGKPFGDYLGKGGSKGKLLDNQQTLEQAACLGRGEKGLGIGRTFCQSQHFILYPQSVFVSGMVGTIHSTARPLEVIIEGTVGIAHFFCLKGELY